MQWWSGFTRIFFSLALIASSAPLKVSAYSPTILMLWILKQGVSLSSKSERESVIFLPVIWSDKSTLKYWLRSFWFFSSSPLWLTSTDCSFPSLRWLLIGVAMVLLLISAKSLTDISPANVKTEIIPTAKIIGEIDTYSKHMLGDKSFYLPN